ncbi:hypothetical protein ACF1BU_06495 [Streptomyces sp. NPDC014724]|uniref:hypothetical protein n=1 Tax=unclassified Streptomyces TaxID=2593676 RepID=UPI0036F77F37
MGAPFIAQVADPEELPHLVAAQDPAAARVLADTWDRDTASSGSGSRTARGRQ